MSILGAVMLSYTYSIIILALDYLCNLVQSINNILALDYFPAWACSVGQEGDGEERHLGEATGAWMFTVQGLQVVKTNQAIYRTQKAVDSWIAYGVFTRCSDFSMRPLFDKFPIWQWTMHDKPGSVIRADRSQQEARLNTASTDTLVKSYS